MPTYEYHREDGSTFEIMQRITDPALEHCPTTGQKVTRSVGGGTGLIFKGNGFYLTDYARKNSSGSSQTPPKEEKVEKPSKEAASTDSTKSTD